MAFFVGNSAVMRPFYPLPGGRQPGTRKRFFDFSLRRPDSGQLWRMSNTATAAAIEIESPVRYKVDAYRVRYGIVEEIKNGRCRVAFQAQTNSGQTTVRETVKTWISPSRLTAWTKPLHLVEGVTLYPSGLEHYTRKA